MDLGLRFIPPTVLRSSCMLSISCGHRRGPLTYPPFSCQLVQIEQPTFLSGLSSCCCPFVNMSLCLCLYFVHAAVMCAPPTSPSPPSRHRFISLNSRSVSEPSPPPPPPVSGLHQGLYCCYCCRSGNMPSDHKISLWSLSSKCSSCLSRLEWCWGC